jgi:hypothetical protein
MLDRSIPTRKVLVHSIPISEVKDMKSVVLWALKCVCKLRCTKNAITMHYFSVFHSCQVVFEVYNIEKCEKEVHFQ